MLIIMCGYPKSGKSTFVDILMQYVTYPAHLVRPGDWNPEKGLTVAENSKWHLACWEHAVDKATKLVSTDGVVILDTCGASPQSLRALISVARSHGHEVVAIFVATPRTICEGRIDPYIIQKYIDRIHNAVLEYRTICDSLIVVKYHKVEQWHQRSEDIATHLALRPKPSLNPHLNPNPKFEPKT